MFVIMAVMMGISIVVSFVCGVAFWHRYAKYENSGQGMMQTEMPTQLIAKETKQERKYRSA
jgi:hypothetical protein